MSAIGAVSSVMTQAAMTKLPASPPPAPPSVKSDNDGGSASSGGQLVNISA